MKGRVIKSTGSWYVVRTDEGIAYDCRIKGKFRLEEFKHTNPVAVGDEVMIEFEETGEAAVIHEILPRKNYISRQSPRLKQSRHIIAANIDQALLIATVAHPRTSTGFIDRFLVTAEAYGIPTHIAFNKQDVFSQKELTKQQQIVDMYKAIGYPSHLVSAQTGQNMKEVEQVLKGKTTLLAGHSGVGKSTVINYLHPDLDLVTRKISESTQKGKHVTTYAQMYALPFEGYIIDTPGIKEFGVLDLEPSEVSHYYREMKDMIANCRFNNCLHINEPGCAVKEALENGDLHPERYKNYINIVEDAKKQQNQY